MNYNRLVIDLMKDVIQGKEISSEYLKEVNLKLGKEFDRCKVYSHPTEEIQSLYDDVLWLQTNILNHE